MELVVKQHLSHLVPKLILCPVCMHTCFLIIQDLFFCFNFYYVYLFGVGESVHFTVPTWRLEDKSPGIRSPFLPRGSLGIELRFLDLAAGTFIYPLSPICSSHWQKKKKKSSVIYKWKHTHVPSIPYFIRIPDDCLLIHPWATPGLCAGLAGILTRMWTPIWYFFLQEQIETAPRCLSSGAGSFKGRAEEVAVHSV